MKTRFALALIPTVAMASLCHADVIELKNGSILNGQYMGGTAATIRFETFEGLQVLQTGDIVALTFTTGSATPATTSPASAATPAPVATVAPAAATTSATQKNITIPAGTTLLVRINQPLSTDSVRTGDRFTAHLDAELVVNDVLVAPKGTPVYGTVLFAERAKRIRGHH